jgi:DNA-binding response OmpR family regulator
VSDARRTRPSAASVMLVSRDWQTRALLRAQLLEEGYSVRAYELLSDVFRALGRAPLWPSLLIAELSGDESADELQQLSAVARRLPVWVLASHSDVNEAVLGGRGFEMILFRPIGLSDLVDRVKLRLKRLSD